jgi:hypothetical protein
MTPADRSIMTPAGANAGVKMSRQAERIWELPTERKKMRAISKSGLFLALTLAVSLTGSDVFAKSGGGGGGGGGRGSGGKVQATEARGARPAVAAVSRTRGCSRHAGGCAYKPTPPAYGGTGGPSQGGIDNPHRHPK